MDKNKRLLLTMVIAMAGPVVFGLDLVVRHFVFGSQPEDLRDFMSDIFTKAAWFATPLPLLGAIVGFVLYRKIYAKALAKDTSADRQKAEAAADTRALMISASLAQLPALAGDLSVMLGAKLPPAICMTATAVVGVFVIAGFGRGSSSKG